MEFEGGNEHVDFRMFYLIEIIKNCITRFLKIEISMQLNSMIQMIYFFQFQHSLASFGSPS